MKFANEPMSLEEMARIGFIDNLEVLIWTDDPGNIPHFHIRDISTKGEKFHCCVRIDRPEYFKHTGKEDSLNSKQKKNLINFLNSTSKLGGIEIKNWDKVVMYWNDNNSNLILPDDLEMPDYNLL